MPALTRLFAVAGFLKSLGSGLTAFVPANSYDNAQVSPTDAICNLSLNANGTCSVSAGTTPSTAPDWKGPNGTGSNFWVRWTNTVGTLTTGTAGSWLSLSGGQTFGVSWTTNAVGSKQCTGTMEIATDAAGANIVATGSITLTGHDD